MTGLLPSTTIVVGLFVSLTQLSESKSLHPLEKQQDTAASNDHAQEVRIYVAPLPAKFHDWPAEDLWGFRSLGDAVDMSQSLWDPSWHAIDKWWVNQLSISPLRTADVDEADVVFVPATIR